MHCVFRIWVAQRKVFTTPLLSEAKSDRNTEQFTKKKSRCQRGGVRGVANQNATTERTNLQTKRCSKDEAAALRKNHVVRRNLRMTFAICYRPHAPATASDGDTSNCQPRSIASEFVHRETVTRVGSCTLPVPMRYPCVSCNASRNRAKQKRDGNSKPVPNANLFGDNVARTRRSIRVGLHG